MESALLDSLPAAARKSSTREQRILEGLQQVRFIARRIYQRVPDSVSLDDLISAGTVGLIAAIDRFDERRGIKLKTYAEFKIRGAILDSLRDMDWAPRRERRQARLLTQAIAALESKLQRVPEDQEVAEALGLSLDEYHEWLVQSNGLKIDSLESKRESESGPHLLRIMADRTQELASETLERLQLEEILARALERMPRFERMVLNLYFQEEMTLREIAEVMNLHESRISQLKGQAIARLRSALQRQWPQQHLQGKAKVKSNSTAAA